MQVSVETIGVLERRMTVTLPATQIDNEVEKRLKKLSQTIKMDGFRPGHVSMKVIQSRFGSDVLGEVRADVMYSTFKEAVAQKDLHPAGIPRFEARTVQSANQFEYTASFDIYPEFKIAELTGVTIEKPTVTLTDDDVGKVLENLRKQHVAWEVVERAAVDGDQLKINFEGSIDNQPFPGGSAKDFAVVIGSKSLIAGFEEGLIGKHAGDDVTLDLQFPEQYHATEFAGKKVKFSVKILSVSAPNYPEIDGQFAEKLGVEDGLEALLKEIRESLERELKSVVHNKIKEQVMDKLIELNKFELPMSLVNLEIENLQKQAQQRLHREMGIAKVPELPIELFKEQAQRRVRLGLLWEKAIKEYEISLDKARVQTQIEEIAASYHNPQEVITLYNNDKNLLAQLRSLILEEQIIDKFLGQAIVVDKPMSYEEAIKQQR